MIARGSTLFGLIVAATMTLTTAGCDDGPSGVRFHAQDAYPENLSAWRLHRLEGDRLILAGDVVPYDLNAPLFTDYAQKLRAIYLPPGTSATYRDYESFDFPVGTIIMKTFFYAKGESSDVVRANYVWQAGQSSLDRSQVRIIETRLLVRQSDGWDALPYVWQGDDAVLRLAGSLERLEIDLADGRRVPLPYIVPTRNECAACHATDHSSGALQPIGPKARHLNRGYLSGPVNQLTRMMKEGRLSGLPDLAAVPASADPAGDEPLDRRARSYLDINCGHCHSPKGAADTSGLHLDAATSGSRALGICKPPIAAGQGTGGRSYSIVPGDAEDSIIVFRMKTNDPGARMPELGRSLSHAEGIDLVGGWIDGLAGECIERDGPSLTGD